MKNALIAFLSVLALGMAFQTTEAHQSPRSVVADVEAALRVELDPGWPVLVTEGRIAGFGESSWNSVAERFEITLRAGMSPELAVDTLTHEWAHLLVWDAVNEGSHDALWGVAYARCYRTAYDTD